jgi:hypothetical protein
MSRILVDIERIVLSGIPLEAAQSRRLAVLTQIALERLLRHRGLAQPFEGGAEAPKKTREMKVSAEANESQIAQELAEVLYRTLDRKA